MKHSDLINYRSNFNESFIGHRSTYLSDVDQLAAIQLSLTLLQKSQCMNESILSPTEIFSLRRRICRRKMKKVEESIVSPVGTPIASSVFDVFSFDEVFTAYLNFTKQCNMFDQPDVQLLLIAGETQNDESKDDNEDIKGTSNFASPISQSPSNPAHLQLRRIIIGYFQLIVNTRDEIALARVIDAPLRGIDHNAFTDIRKLAASKNMPMYQAVSSFVRQVNLAGKGYAPDEKHVLFQHKEGLKEFMALMDKLQTEIDECSKIAAGLHRMLKILKTAFIRCKTPVFSTNVVTTVVQELADKVKEFFVQDSVNDKEAVLLLRDFLDYASWIYGNDIGVQSSQLCGVLSTPFDQKTMLKRISTLATQFKTPEVTDETPKKPRPLKEVNTVQEVCDDDIDMQNNNSSPEHIKLIRCQVVHETTSDELVESPTVKLKQNLRKASTNTKRSKIVKKKVSKKLKLPPGQKTLLQFFK